MRTHIASLLLFAVGLFASPAVAQRTPEPAARELFALPSLAPMVEVAKRAVVNVDVQVAAGPGRGHPGFHGNEGPFDSFRGSRGKPQVVPSAGSGFIIDGRGLLLTNNHVVENAVSIRVHLDDGREFDAEVLGRDPLTDVALIKLKGKLENLPVARLGDSDAMRVGDWVVAIGNPFRLASSVSLGIVSARARDIKAGPYDDFLQTDAAINPGNSGGPLFNARGEVIGINTMIVGGGAGGIGFAVPINLAKALVPQLEKNGNVTRGWLGVGIQDLTADLAKALGVPASDGALISNVNDGSPAQRAGLKEDDVITSLDGEKIPTGGALSRAIALKRPESTVNLSIYRTGKASKVAVKLGTRPDLENVGGRERPDQADERQQRLGLAFGDLDPRFARQNGLPPQGVLIGEVAPGSPAERAELRPGMVVVEANRKPIRNSSELVKALKAAPSGSVVLLRVIGPEGTGRLLRALQVP